LETADDFNGSSTQRLVSHLCLRFTIYAAVWQSRRLKTAERGCLSRSMFDSSKPVNFCALIWQSKLLRVGHPRSNPA
jgi:hypothetical protein